MQRENQQLLAIAPGVKQDFALSVSDFNHLGQLSASTLLKYAGDARWVAFSTWPAFSRMMEEEPGSDVVVKAHFIRFLRPNTCFPSCIMGVTQTPHAVSSTSMTLAYEFFDDPKDPFAQVLTVCVRVKDGNSLPLPSYVADELVWRHKATELEDTRDIVLLSTAIERVKLPNVVSNSTNRCSLDVLVRYSDTDRKKIVNSHRLMQFFEDSYGNSKTPDVIYMEVLGELRAKTTCELIGVPNNETGGQEMISFLIEKDSGKTAARAYISWASKTIKDGK